ncbi:MAG TPA: 2-oxoglutarate dehydrogenase E1 component [Candidatus Polarisedimenticolaceae bacterium]|nr:2-oxoglutarate dehydrogenase E1 component [Candidatus Polarisedimenticolaceae bacterium]
MELDAFRRWGFLAADLDPLGRLRPAPPPELQALLEQKTGLRSIYCGPIGADFMRLPDPRRRQFVADALEAAPTPTDRRRLLRRILEAERFERFLHSRYVGTKRYSLEGAAALIPLLDAVLDAAAERGARTVLLGMSHRGRLTVMAQVVGVPLDRLLAGFEDVNPETVLGSGDVRYHLGATGSYRAASGQELQLHLVSNPSHLEAVDPVMAGRARARQRRLGDGPAARRSVLPVLLHGDAAFAGQGICAEALNLAELPGYAVGGTVHVVVNNLIGFTTEPRSLHSSRFATDVARRLDVPILHVNGFDPEAVVRVGRLALEYRAAFESDVVVDLIGYRRYGHSEVDDPTTSQPLLYRAIQDLPPLYHGYAARIGASPAELTALEREADDRLQQALGAARELEERPRLSVLPAYWDAFVGGKYDPAFEVDTAVAAARLEPLGRRIATAPDGFQVHAKVRRGLEQRREMAAGELDLDFGMAEALAFATLLEEGTPIRLTGQDTRRGTFNQRHAILVDTASGAEHCPLAQLSPAFTIYDSPLAEAAPLGFEYGYSRDYPETLVLWEAQFGDFVNGAQVIVDQFLVAGEDKWGLLSGLVLLLPHGYEGQGSEHSSARLERWLDLAAEDNIQVCQPTTASQYFHLLRRQALRRWRKPLVVLTPKGLLRAPAAASPREELSRGRFFTVLPDAPARAVRRVLLCSGKIAHDLMAERERRQAADHAVVRLEQLYPFPAEALRETLAAFLSTAEIAWVQEEPRNMGALDYVRPQLQLLLGGRSVAAITRRESACPATGSPRAHALEQQALLAAAFARAGSD